MQISGSSDGSSGSDEVHIIIGPLPGLFTEENGQVVLEAESFTNQLHGHGAAANHQWEETLAVLDSSGGVAMVAQPNSGVRTGDSDDGPRLDFDVQFTQTGTYYVWVRMWGANDSDDSLHAGLGGTPASFGGAGISDSSNAWHWEEVAGGSRVTVDVQAPATHTVNIWMREDGTLIDKVLLTTDPEFVPSDHGPPESAVSPIVAQYRSSNGSGRGSIQRCGINGKPRRQRCRRRAAWSPHVVECAVAADCGTGYGGHCRSGGGGYVGNGRPTRCVCLPTNRG